MTKQTPAAFCTAHGLPDLTRWFTFEDEVTARSVRSTMHEKLIGFGEYVERLLYPEGITDGWESGVLSEDQHEQLAVLHRMIALLEKDCALLDLESTPEQDLAMIARLAKEWPAVVTQLKQIIATTRVAYDPSKTKLGPASYLG